MLDVSTFSLNDLLLLFVVDFDFCYVIIFWIVYVSPLEGELFLT
jgi:hypothetical protein